MKMKRFLFIAISFLMMISCSKHKITSAELLKKLDIDTMRMSSGNPDTIYLATVGSQVSQFVKTNPKDSSSIFLLMRLATQYEAHKQYKKCLVVLDDIQTMYPNSIEAVQALLIQGYFYNSIGEYEKAKAKYNEYMQKHSDYDPNMTKSVQLELDNMGKTPEQILHEIQAKADTTTNQNP